VEAHAALVWLDGAVQPNRDRPIRPDETDSEMRQPGPLAVMKFWFRALYPEFSAYLDLEGRQSLPASAEMPRHSARAPFDPARKLLTRFAEWSREGFGIPNDRDVTKDQEADNAAHKEAVEALAGCAARIPWQPYVKELQDALRGKETQFKPFRETMQEACSNAYFPRFLRLRDAEDWSGLVAAFDDPDFLPALAPILRMWVALAAGKVDNQSRGFEIALQTLDELKDDDIRDKREDEEHPPMLRVMWQNVLHANIESVLKMPDGQRTAVFARIRESLRDPSRAARLKPFLQSCEAMLDRALESVAFNTAIEKMRKHLDDKDFLSAKQAIIEVPDTSKEIREEKAKILDFIAEHEEDAKIPQVIERVKALVQALKFDEARRVVRSAWKRESFAQLRENYLRQIDEVDREYKDVVRENEQLRRQLRHRYDEYQITQLTLLNKIDAGNPFQMNQLLKFLRDN
jgi:hypothetical protein